MARKFFLSVFQLLFGDFLPHFFLVLIWIDSAVHSILLNSIQQFVYSNRMMCVKVCGLLPFSILVFCHIFGYNVIRLFYKICLYILFNFDWSYVRCKLWANLQYNATLAFLLIKRLTHELFLYFKAIERQLDAAQDCVFQLNLVFPITIMYNSHSNS